MNVLFVVLFLAVLAVAGLLDAMLRSRRRTEK